LTNTSDVQVRENARFFLVLEEDGLPFGRSLKQKDFSVPQRVLRQERQAQGIRKTESSGYLSNHDQGQGWVAISR